MVTNAAAPINEHEHDDGADGRPAALDGFTARTTGWVSAGWTCGAMVLPRPRRCSAHRPGGPASVAAGSDQAPAANTPR